MSTFTSYLQLTRDYSRTLSNLSKTPQIANASQYYQANIGKVKTVDDLMKDQKLYSYVMKAAGLEDMTYAKAFIKKVLLSDLNDTKSFANQLTDKRYFDLAKTFNFNTKGEVASVTDIQSDQQEQTLTALYDRQLADRDIAASKTIADYSAGIDALTSVDDLLANKSLFNFALSAYGLGDIAKNASPAFFREILTKDLSDPTHPIYAIPTDTAKGAALVDNLRSLVLAFNFETDGSVSAGGVQSTEQKGATVAGWLNSSGASSAKSSLLFSADYYRNAIGAITSAQGLLDNATAYNLALTAYGLDPTTVDKDDVLAALTSDLGDPGSAANTLGLGYQRLAQAFNFAADGSITSGLPIQTAAAIEATVSGYLANANAAGLPQPSEYDLYKRAINKPGVIGNVDDFLTLLGGKSPVPNDDLVNDNAAASVANFVLRSFGYDLNTRLSDDFLRSVLTSDLSDPASFANTQTDKKWVAFASLFNFQPDGSLPPDGIVQDEGKFPEMLERYAGKGFGGVALSTQATYGYRYDSKNIRNVDQFLDDTSTFSFALVAFGFDRTSASKDYFRRILTDSAFATAQAATDPRVQEFADAFNFDASGQLADGQSLQSKINEDRTVERFLAQSDSSSGAYATRVTNEYKVAIQNIRTVSDFVKPANDAVYNFALTAFGINPASTTKDEIAKVLSSNLADASSVANKLGGSFLELAKAFNFAAGGVVPTGQQTQSDAQLSATVNNYLARNNRASVTQTTSAKSNFTANINSLEGRAALRGTRAVDEFLADPKLYNYALVALGLDPKTQLKSTIRQALIADKTSNFSFLDVPGNQKYKALAEALNFDPDGSVGTPKQAQTASDALRLAQKYAASYPPNVRPDYAKDRPTDQENLIKAESDYYATAILKVSTVDEFVSDKRAVTYVTKAFGLDASIDTRTLTRILTSDLNDPKSFANSSKDLRYQELAATFNFDTKGLARRVPEQSVQSSGGVFETQSNYLQQTLETNAGADSAGVRLALYFKRKAPELTSTFAILGDKALLEVARTAAGIPQAALTADIDILKRTFEKKFTVADFKDPKKLDAFIKRFTALYDVENNGGLGSSNSIALTLLSGGTGIGFSQDTLASLQNIRFRQF